jgi:hypothetical protein
MKENRDLSNIEHRVFRIFSEEKYESMMLTSQTIFLIDERVSETEEFCAIFEKNSFFTKSAEIKRETVDSFSLRKDDTTFNIYYNIKTLGEVPSSLSIPDSDDLEDFMFYIKKEWHFNKSYKTMTPDEAKAPLEYSLFIILLATTYTLYLHWFGGETNNLIIIFFTKVGEIIGALGLILLASIISFFIVIKIRNTQKRPPYQTWLKRPGIVDQKKAASK